MAGSDATEPFELGGDPAAIRASAARWAAFAGSASGASTRIASLDTSGFVGSEGEEYRSALNSDLRPHLDRTAAAWTKVHGALNAYADTLEGLQRRMATLAATASSQRTTLSRAQTALSDSKATDCRHQVLACNATAPTGSPPATYHSHTAQDAGAVSDAQIALQGSIDAANRIHAEHEAAVTLCCTRIDEARRMRFVKPPGWFSRAMHSVGHWVSEHAGTLLKISAVLKTVSAIAGVLALIPVLAPVMGPIAFATGAAAFAIDLTVSAATGNWDVQTLILDGVGLIPGSKAIMGMRSLQGLGRAGRVMRTVAESDKVWTAVDRVNDVANIGVAGYDLATAKKRGWQDYLALATAVAGAKVGAPQGIRRSLHLGDRDFRRFNAIKAAAVSTVDAGASGYDLADKIKNGKAGWQDYLGTATKVAGAASTVATVTKYRAPGDAGGYQPGQQMHHRAWETPEYTGADTKAAFTNAYRHARTTVGLHLAAGALVVSLHTGGGGGRGAQTR